MNEDKFIDVLTNGLPQPKFNHEYIEYYRNNPWQIPHKYLKDYIKYFEAELSAELDK